MRKQFSALALVLLMLLAALLGTSCGIKELKVEKNPQLVFVQGNALDLSAGALSADGKTVAFDADGVEVSGYNKDQLGEQTLTVTYKKKTVELKVTVVPRVQAAEQYVYFVGESIDTVGLRLRVTKDDGTYILVSGDDANVTVSGFTSEAPNDALSLNVTCRDGGVDYTGSITVSVVTPEISFKKPRKTEYGSHETELDTTGISLTLKNADGKTVRNINNSELKLEGFDPTAATAENPSVTQTVKVSFGGREMASFDVTVSYSNVSRIRDAAKVFAALDWSHYERPDNGMYLPAGTTDEMGKSAMDTLELYYGLTDKDAALISQNDMDAIARLAVIYGYNQWTAAIGRAYANVFELYLGEITYTCTNLQDAKNGLEKLRAASDDDTKLILRYSTLLKNEKLTNQCGKTIIYNGAQEDGVDVTLGISDMLSVVYDSNYFTTKVVNVLDKMIALPEILNVPADWTRDSLVNYKDAIEAAYNKILEIYLSDAGDIGAFEIVNNWREKKDFFEILYRYYFGEYKSTDTEISEAAGKKIDKLAEFYLPGPMQELYGKAVMAQLMQLAMSSYKSEYSSATGEVPPLMESTDFFIYYRDVIELSTEILNLNDELYNELYTRVFRTVVLQMMWSDCGYYDLLGTSAMDEDCLNVLEQYFDMWEAFETDNTYMTTAAFDTAVAKMFSDFVALRPNQQYNVMSTINYLYSENQLPSMVLYPNDGALFSEFATFIYVYYLDTLGVDITKENTEDNNYKLFTDLLIALECYANNDLNNFGSYMEQAQTAYAALTSAQKTTFDANLSFLYEKYSTIFTRFEKTTDAEGAAVYVYKTIELGDYAAVFEKLATELSRAQIAKLFIEDLAQFTGSSVDLYLAYIASYERIRVYADQILTCGNDEILRAFYEQPYGSSTDVSIYRSFYDAHGNYQRYLLMLGVGEEGYDNENTVALRSFLREYADYFWASVSLMYPSIPNTLGDSFELNADNLKTMMKDFRKLSNNEKYLLYGLDSLSLYYGGMVTYLNNLYPNSNVPELGYTLMLVEVYHYTYETAPDQTFTMTDGTVMTAKEMLLEAWTEFDSAYWSLEASEKAIFDQYFEEMMEYYRAICDSIDPEA